MPEPLGLTNGEIKTFLAAAGGHDPEHIHGYMVLLLDNDQGMHMMSSAAHSAAGRHGEMLMLMHSLVRLAETVATENESYRDTLIQLGLILRDDEPEEGNDEGWTLP